MKKKFIELRMPRDIGELIDVFLQFIKENFRIYLPIFIRYNGLFILGFLITSYLMVSGLWGEFFSNSSLTVINADTHLIFGILIFMLLAILTSIYNYSLAAAFMHEYVKSNGKEINRKEVFLTLRKNLWKAVLFVILMTLLYFLVTFIGILAALIPIIGTLIYYFIFLGFSAGTGMAFMHLFQKEKKVRKSYSVGFDLITFKFWKSILVNLVLTFLLGVMMMAVLTIPTILLTTYSFLIVDNFGDSVISMILSVLGLTVFMIAYALYQSFSQFLNGILYFSVYEEYTNEAARERIFEIGIENE